MRKQPDNAESDDDSVGEVSIYENIPKPQNTQKRKKLSVDYNSCQQMSDRNAYIQKIFSNSKYCRFDDQSCISDSTS